ncbi:unnamed protein product [Adineta steineri]|uniref:G-protein coupled receptors family 1 profile domain-containing protein n=1 Tax=Adineta steineri TaxID=433720 RepID=A0A818VAX5_9BILA|nr:unnamed protein product [Adineta steineri]CAF3704324.1 unnamed protein product [Adineta steineri]
MSSSYMSRLDFISQQITIYLGLTILIAGVIGGCLTVLIFLSLRTFRESSCAFYLIIMSIFNICALIMGLTSQISSIGFSIDWTQTSLFFCKFRVFFIIVSIMISLTSMCMATIDQYWATCHRPQWQRFCNIKLAHRITIISIIGWILYGIPCLIYYDQVILISTGQVTCIVTNAAFQWYLVYVANIIIYRLIPLIIMFVFGLLAYYNLQKIAFRTIPIVRRQLDKQLTTMVLIQIGFTSFTIWSYAIVNIIISYSDLNEDSYIAAQLELANVITLNLLYVFFASPFYIYLCVSERFRRQFMHVLINIHLRQWQRRNVAVNQVMPEALQK